MKPKKWTCRHEAVAAFIRLEQRERRVEFHLEEAVSEVWAVTHKYTKATIRTCISSQICANARPNHSIHHNDLERVGPGLYRRCVAAWSPRPLPPGQSELVAREFHRALEQLCRRCERELHFTPTKLKKLLRRVGGVEAARRYIHTPKPNPNSTSSGTSAASTKASKPSCSRPASPPSSPTPTAKQHNDDSAPVASTRQDVSVNNPTPTNRAASDHGQKSKPNTATEPTKSLHGHDARRH